MAGFPRAPEGRKPRAKGRSAAGQSIGDGGRGRNVADAGEVYPEALSRRFPAGFSKGDGLLPGGGGAEPRLRRADKSVVAPRFDTDSGMEKPVERCFFVVRRSSSVHEGPSVARRC